MFQKLLILFFGLSTYAPLTGQENAAPDSTVMAFASDTQAPMWVETIFLKQHQNRTATRMIFQHLESVRPGSLFLLGDVVNLGYSNRQWKPMDLYLGQLREAGVSVHAVLGNHEVMGQPAQGERKFQQRFPDHVRTGYVQVKDSVAVVLLNSNFGTLTKGDNEKQESWFRATLEALDADSSILYVIAGCHHSPYTNSRIVNASTSVQEKFVEPFLKSQKGRLFLSGHCHGFEHYKKEGKDFIVIGGGGGLHQPLKKGRDILPDLAADYKPLFHYLTVKRTSSGLQVQSHRLNAAYNGFEEGLSLTIPPAAAGTLQATASRENATGN